MEIRYKNPDGPFNENSLCYYKGDFFRVTNIKDDIVTIKKCNPEKKEDLYIFTSSNEVNIYEPIRAFPNEYDLRLEPLS